MDYEGLCGTFVFIQLEGETLVFVLLSGLLKLDRVSRRAFATVLVFGLIKPKTTRKFTIRN